MGAASGKSFAEMMLENELAHRSQAEVEAGLDAIAGAMDASIEAGCSSTGVLPGRLKVKRRAPQIAAGIRNRPESHLTDPLAMMDSDNLGPVKVTADTTRDGQGLHGTPNAPEGRTHAAH